MPYYQGHCPDPLKEALLAITGKEVPRETCLLDGVFNCSELDDGELFALGDWCTQNARPHWATGDGILEAAELLVSRAKENDNI